MARSLRPFSTSSPFLLAVLVVACSAKESTSPASTGGTANGSASQGGSSTGGTVNGGSQATQTGGTSSGGSGAGGVSQGGTTPGSGGNANGGAVSGGATNAGASSGGVTASGGLTASGGVAGSSAGNGVGGTSGGASAGAPSNSGGSSSGTGSGCSASGLLFCDDFESGTAGMAPPSPKWAVVLTGSGGSVVIDATTPAHSGQKSVHVSSNGSYQTFFRLSGAPVFPSASGLLYLRLYIRLGAPMTGGHNTYYKAGAAGSSSSEHETRVGVMNSMLMINQPAGDRGFLSNQNYYTDGMKPGIVFAEKTWTCVEALFDPPHSTFDIWVEGKEVPDLHRTDWQQDALGAFHFGFEKYAGPDADVWYDDIAVSDHSIGCK